MHTINLTHGAANAIKTLAIFPSLADLGQIAEFGDRKTLRLRHILGPKDVREKIVGCDWQDIETEYELLSSQFKRHITESKSNVDLMTAICIFHMYFEAIHPFTDGNGRIGRLILANQCSHFLHSDASVIQNSLVEMKQQYRAVFLAPIQNSSRLEILVNLLAIVANLDDWGYRQPESYVLSPKRTIQVEGQFRFFSPNNMRFIQ